MLFTPVQVRVIARACISRYEWGDGTIIEIVDGYKMSAENRILVLAQIYAFRPDLKPTEDPLPQD